MHTHSHCFAHTVNTVTQIYIYSCICVGQFYSCALPDKVSLQFLSSHGLYNQAAQIIIFAFWVNTP